MTTGHDDMTPDTATPTSTPPQPTDEAPRQPDAAPEAPPEEPLVVEEPEVAEERGEGVVIELHPEVDVLEPEVDVLEPEVEVLEPEIVFEDPRVVQLEATVEELTGRLKAVSMAYKKQQDDIAEARARLERQAKAKEQIRRGEVVASLFEPVQNLRRSIESMDESVSIQLTIDGLGMVLKQFMDAFDRLGLEEVPGVGARFNPKIHEALAVVPVHDRAMHEVIIQVHDTGYRIGSQLIQASRVIVAQYDEPEPDESEGAESEE